MSARRRPGIFTRVLLPAIAIGLALNTTLDHLVPIAYGWGVVRSIAVNLTLIVTISAWHDRRLLAARWHAWRLRNHPPVLDEDGNVRVAVLSPGERLEVILDPDRHPLAAAVRRPNGTIRVTADWSHR